MIAADDQTLDELYLAAVARVVKHPIRSNGLYDESVTRCDGSRVFYQYTWSDAFGWELRRKQYREQFEQEVPTWVREEHPVHRQRLCRLAMERGRLLPEASPRLRRLRRD